MSADEPLLDDELGAPIFAPIPLDQGQAGTCVRAATAVSITEIVGLKTAGTVVFDA